MPVISYFFGIYVRMYHDDHNPPHFHVEYQGYEALMAIESGEILSGKLPSKAIKIVREWAAEHQAELLENWQYAIKDVSEAITSYLYLYESIPTRQTGSQ